MLYESIYILYIREILILCPKSHHLVAFSIKNSLEGEKFSFIVYLIVTLEQEVQRRFFFFNMRRKFKKVNNMLSVPLDQYLIVKISIKICFNCD